MSQSLIQLILVATKSWKWPPVMCVSLHRCRRKSVGYKSLQNDPYRLGSLCEAGGNHCVCPCGLQWKTNEKRLCCWEVRPVQNWLVMSASKEAWGQCDAAEVSGLTWSCSLKPAAVCWDTRQHSVYLKHLLYLKIEFGCLMLTTKTIFKGCKRFFIPNICNCKSINYSSAKFKKCNATKPSSSVLLAAVSECTEWWGAQLHRPSFHIWSSSWSPKPVVKVKNKIKPNFLLMIRNACWKVYVSELWLRVE